jgi:hypothetical protein
VGSVVECSQQPGLVGQRVVGEINVNCAGFSCADAVFQRNHAPGRLVWTFLCQTAALSRVNAICQPRGMVEAWLSVLMHLTGLQLTGYVASKQKT